MSNPRMTITKWLVVIAVAAFLISIFVVPYRERHPTPARWAKRIADGYANRARKLKDQDRYRESLQIVLGMARQFEELAADFERHAVDWEETTNHGSGPFSDQLTLGEAMIVRQNAKVRLEFPEPLQLDDDGQYWAVLNPDKLWTLSQGTACVVVEEYQTFEYADVPLRPIRVQILDGPDRGKLIYIQRIYLRRDQQNPKNQSDS